MNIIRDCKSEMVDDDGGGHTVWFLDKFTIGEFNIALELLSLDDDDFKLFTVYYNNDTLPEKPNIGEYYSGDYPHAISKIVYCELLMFYDSEYKTRLIGILRDIAVKTNCLLEFGDNYVKISKNHDFYKELWKVHDNILLTCQCYEELKDTNELTKQDKKDLKEFLDMHPCPIVPQKLKDLL